MPVFLRICKDVIGFMTRRCRTNKDPQNRDECWSTFHSPVTEQIKKDGSARAATKELSTSSLFVHQPFSFCFLHLPPHFPFMDPHLPVEGFLRGLAQVCCYTKAEGGRETAGSISIYLFPPVVKMLAMAVQRLMAVFFHRWQGVTLESKSTSSHVLPGLSLD